MQEDHNAHTLLIVEDDMFLQDGLSDLLRREGYQVLLAGTIAEARLALQGNDVALLILDVGLPDGDGYSFCQAIRAEGHKQAILFLTARDEEYELVRGLDVGGDDYLTKPFRAMELLSRIKALLRRVSRGDLGQSETTQGLDYTNLHYVADGLDVSLTPTEFFILQKLIENAHQIVTRDQLLDSIWDHDGQFIDDNTLSVHISRLREKIGRNRIVTVRGVGYRWQGV